MEKDLIIGIDSSTTACKAVVWDRFGAVIGEGRAGLTTLMPRLGWHEQRAEDWWRALCRATRQAVRGISPSRLAAVSIAHQRETFGVLDHAGIPIRNGILWMDERAGGFLAGLDQAIGKDEFHRLTGKPLTGNLTAVKLAWLREMEPEIYRRIGSVVDVQAYLAGRLTGKSCTSWGGADPTGLFNITARRWSEEILSTLELSVRQMPQIAAPGEIMGMVSGKAARQTGLPEGLLLAGGLGDGQAGGLGINITSPGTAYLALGTSVVSGTFSNSYSVSRAFRTTTGGIPGSYLMETVLLGGTYTIEWMLKTFLGKKGAAVEQARRAYDLALDQIPPGANGLMVVPYWNSAMNPYWDSTAAGIVVGWRGFHRPEHLYRAILEGIAYELRLHFEGVESSIGQPIQQVVAMGGGAQNRRWLQIIADVIGKPVARTRTVQAAALGAGMLAATAGGLFANVSEAAVGMASPADAFFYPDANRHTAYTLLYEDIYRRLYPAIRGELRRIG